MTIAKAHITCSWIGRHGDHVKVVGAPDLLAARAAAIEFAELPEGIVLDNGRFVKWGYEEPQPHDWQDHYVFWSCDEHPPDQREWWEK